METFQVLALIFSVFLMLCIIPCIIVDILFVGWAVFLSWISTLLNLVCSIGIIVGACQNYTSASYNKLKKLLFVSGSLALLVIVIFFIYGYFNWPKILTIVFTIPLIFFLNKLEEKAPSIIPINNPAIPQPIYAQPASTPMVSQPYVQPATTTIVSQTYIQPVNPPMQAQNVYQPPPNYTPIINPPMQVQNVYQPPNNYNQQVNSPMVVQNEYQSNLSYDKPAGTPIEVKNEDDSNDNQPPNRYPSM